MSAVSPYLAESESSPSHAHDSAANAVSLIIDRAKVDRNGVFWSLSESCRAANSSQFEVSIASGTPGILLALIEYFALFRDKEVSELIHKGVSWLSCRTQKLPFQHGFYAGTAGLWYLYRRLHEVLPEYSAEWREAAKSALAQRSADGNLPGNLMTGVAGTLVGVFESLQLDSDEESRMIQSLLSELVAAAKPCSDGAIWDFGATSIRVPVGFGQGNAGVDYCLAFVRKRMALTFNSLLTGSLSYADSLFDPGCGNWPDQDAVLSLKRLRTEEIEKHLAKGDAATVFQNVRADDSVSWGTGTVGILISRALVWAAYGNEPLGQRAAEDCRRAIRRLSRVTEQDLAAMDLSILTGVSGIALGLDACLRVLPQVETAPLRSVAEKSKAAVLASEAVVDGDDLSLIGGVAGHLYALMKTTGRSPAPSCLHPLEDLSAKDEHLEISDGDLTPFLTRRLPASSLVPEVRSALSASLVSLRTVGAATELRRRQDPDDILTKSIRHELSLYEALSETRFQECFWREAVRRTQFIQKYAEGFDENLLFERFRFAESVAVFVLDFDPISRTARPPGQPCFVLRQKTSNGVLEGRLSALQHALLSSFVNGAFALDVIRDVIRRVETPNVTQRQLVDLSRKMIRGFVQAGYLVADSPGRFSAWFCRRRLRTVYTSLFVAVAE